MRPKQRPDPSHWVDETVPDLASVFKTLGLDQSAFAGWLSPRLADYRSAMHLRRSWPSVSEQKDELIAIQKGAKAALEMVRKIGPFASASINGAASRHRVLEEFVGWRDRLGQDLLLLEAMAGAAAEGLASTKSKRGPKAKGPRDTLLAAVVGWLRDAGLTSVKALELAEAILIACRVPVAEDPQAQRRAVRKAL